MSATLSSSESLLITIGSSPRLGAEDGRHDVEGVDVRELRADCDRLDPAWLPWREVLALDSLSFIRLGSG